MSFKAQPHAEILHTCHGVFKRHCDASKSHRMHCDAKSIMLVNLLPMLEYLSYLLSDFQAILSITMGI